MTAPLRPGSAAAEPAGAASPSGAPPVIYIAGSGRSGSTLLERAIGAISGFVNVGELIDLFSRPDMAERCGCGQSFASCPFWSGVGERAYGGWAAAGQPATRRLQTRVARQRHLPRLLAAPLSGAAFRADVASYGASYARVYAAIAAEAGAQYVVDASKWPVQALALARAGLDIRVIHLVRDVRGVAYSLGKRDVVRPHTMDRVDVMSHKGAVEGAARWVACQSQAESLRRCGLRVTRTRYEDFVADPGAAVTAALTDLGAAPDPATLGHLRGGRMTLGPSHGLSGNPSRFRHGEITLRGDDAWREHMSRADRAVVTAIGLPFLLRYRG